MVNLPAGNEEWREIRLWIPGHGSARSADGLGLRFSLNTRIYPQKKYDTRIAAVTPAKSAANPQTTAWRLRLMPTAPK